MVDTILTIELHRALRALELSKSQLGFVAGEKIALFSYSIFFVDLLPNEFCRLKSIFFL